MFYDVWCRYASATSAAALSTTETGPVDGPTATPSVGANQATNDATSFKVAGLGEKVFVTLGVGLVAAVFGIFVVG